MSFYEMARDAGYQGEEARMMAEHIEREEYEAAYRREHKRLEAEHWAEREREHYAAMQYDCWHGLLYGPDIREYDPLDGVR